MEKKVSLFDILTLFEEEQKIEELKESSPKSAENILERMLIVLHRQENRIERIEKVTKLMAKAIDNLRVTTELLAKSTDEGDYKSFFIANYGKKIN